MPGGLRRGGQVCGEQNYNQHGSLNLSTEDLYNQRLARILKAVALDKPDRTPLVLEYSEFAANVTRTPMAAFLRSPQTNVDIMIQAFHRVGELRGCD
jgi:hypothetical protein